MQRSAIVIFLFVLSVAVKAQHPSAASPQKSTSSKTDSLQIKTTVEIFYTWYIDLIHAHRINKDFNPSFKKSSDSMTMLDFTRYRTGLKRHRFTNRFIEERVKRFDVCDKSLRKIPYKEFLGYTDLDQMESIACDFSNTYEWTGGMEPHDGADVVNVKLLTKNNATAIITIFDIVEGKKLNMSTMTARLLRANGIWYIDDIE